MSKEIELSELDQHIDQTLDQGMLEALEMVPAEVATHGSKPTDILDLNALMRVYKDELEGLKAARADMVTKRDWFEKSISIIDKRIEVNLGALKTLQTPVVVKADGEEPA